MNEQDPTAYVGQVTGIRLLANGSWKVQVEFDPTMTPMGLMEIGARVAVARLQEPLP